MKLANAKNFVHLMANFARLTLIYLEGHSGPLTVTYIICVSLSSRVNFCVACRDSGIKVQMILMKDCFL